MGNPEIVFVGPHTFTFTLPSSAEVEEENYETVHVPGFEAVCVFRRLDQLQATDEPTFTHAQAVCVMGIEDWDFRGANNASVLALPEAVRWVLCFPVVKEGAHYALETSEIPPDGDDVFFYFTGTVPFGTPIRAVPSLDDLKFLSPLPQSKLALVRAKDWRWDGEAVLVAPQDVAEIEIVLDSGVRVL